MNFLVFAFIFSLIIYFALAQFETESDTRCYSNYCQDKQIQCSGSISKNCSGTVGHRKFLGPSQCNCCPYCFDYLKENDNCGISSNGPPENLCGPLLQCESDDETGDQKCVRMERPNSCIHELNAYNQRLETGKLGIADFQPSCDAHGNYMPRQCLPASTICVCMNEDGTPIFGMGEVRNAMDCACSRDMDRLKSINGHSGTLPHCLSNGNYDELQCSLKSRSCYCRLKPGTKVGLSEIKDLPCYNTEIHTVKYLRPCEIARGEIDTLFFDAEETNTTALIRDIPNCSPDGNFAPVQSYGQKWICVDEENWQIEKFEMSKTSATALKPPADMNCQCARMRHFLGSSSTGKPKCCPNGRFRGWQCLGSTCYCVNKQSGIQDMNYEEVPRDQVTELPCYEVC